MKRRDTTILFLVFSISLIACIIYFQYYNSTSSTAVFNYNNYNPNKNSNNNNKPIPVIFPDPFELHQPNPKTEKFLSYLPHSGFHNQRIELENALLLAAYLNRTLLVPPVFLASPAMPWLRYEKLYERLLFQTKNGLDHCVTIHDAGLPLPSECLNVFRWTNVPWTFFYNMSAIQEQAQVPVVFRSSLDYEWFYHTQDRLGKLTEDDIYFFKDMSPYEYQIHDDRGLDLPLDRFNYRIDLMSLQTIEHRVLHFGSMFGSYRVLAETDEHAERLRMIRSNMIFRNPVLSSAAERIVEQLGGANQFVGMHVRVGDGIFKLRASILVDDIYHQLVNTLTDLNLEQVTAYEGGIDQHNVDRTESTEYEIKLRSFHPVDETNYTKPIEVVHPDWTEEERHRLFDQEPRIARRLQCQPGDATTKRFKNTVVYIATDAPDPRNHPLLRKLFNVFPCTFILSDFVDELKDIKRLEVVEEKVRLESYLIPMVDAMISAYGHTFFGTPHSTFTSYIERQLHPVYTGKPVQVMGLLDYLNTTTTK
ncbi:MAG: CigA protein [Benjaminiella poitrasii]|nr:MAG: CigA protein [Benjaminiella poitrasii]